MSNEKSAPTGRSVEASGGVDDRFLAGVNDEVRPVVVAILSGQSGEEHGPRLLVQAYDHIGQINASMKE